ncbi:hypothetical protein BXU06_07375 [Aquaspirillum sp. LM1]|uniref:RAMP superfamily CRISPR-associated protein n=1 Tax=Aquaspirillum sp. LM1 TaxID=1938604 RepID=UPI000983CA8C|nr:RAMP superfamily CRISPR-associated protein [Aquaspirillum sp. LM1]AQR64906.1 hypothetical protein BXU06_07375 [Aquaspirillum sp. LM1]
MTALMREELADQPPKADHAHAGLWLQRGWPAFVTGDAEGNKTGHINKLCAIQPSTLYKKAFSRWEETVKTLPGVALFATVSQRLLIGSNAASALETGVAIQHSYGMPMIPGSAVKGCVRAYAQQLGLGAEYLAMLFGLDEGELAGPGGLVWHDAWWRPGSQDTPFVADVVTVHHPDYYQGNAPLASDTDTPVPNAQLATQGEFFFYIGCECPDSQPWAELAMQLLKAALHGVGIGGKRAAGYGRMGENHSRTEKFTQDKRQQTLSATEQIRQWLDLPSSTLAKKFGKDFNKTKTEAAQKWPDTPWDTIRCILEEQHAKLLKDWALQDKDSHAYKAWRKLHAD